MIGRILLAAVLAMLAMPTASNLAPDHDSAATTTPFPAPLAADVAAHLELLAGSYGIATPNLRFVSSKAAGVTIRNPAGPQNPAEIRLGVPVQGTIYRERPELLKAVASHEFGHAVMIARQDDFPPAAVLIMYAIGLFGFLVVWPCKRAIVGGAVAITAALAVMMRFQTWSIAHNAFLGLLVILSIASLLIWRLGLGRHLAAMPGSRALLHHMPSARSLAFAGMIALPSFLSAAWLAGRMNVERELRADVFGACATTPASMKAALVALAPLPSSSLKETLDTFHPAMAERVAVLSALEQPLLRESACAALLSGTTPLTIAGRTVQ